MNRDKVDLKKIYNQVIEEYNKTLLSVKFGWKHTYEEYTLKQITILYKLINSKSKILDIGTGSGIIPITFKKLGCEVITIDYKETSGEALDNIKLFGLKSLNVNLNEGKLPFESEYFDLIYMGDVIEHLPNSPKKILLECNRVLKKNSKMIVSTPNSLRLIVRLKTLFGYSPWPEIKTFYYDEYNGTHHHEYSLSELKFVFTDNQFMIEKIHFFEQNLKVDKRLNSLFGKIIKKILLLILNFTPKLRSNIILVVKN